MKRCGAGLLQQRTHITGCGSELNYISHDMTHMPADDVDERRCNQRRVSTITVPFLLPHHHSQEHPKAKETNMHYLN